MTAAARLIALPVAQKRAREVMTPEGLAVPLTLAARGSRAGALILDVMIIMFGLIAFHIALITVASGLIDGSADMFASAPSGASEFLQIMLIIVVFISWYGYFLVQELGPRGATLGKRIVGIRIAARRGERLTPEAVIARNLLRDIEIFYPLVFMLVTAINAIDGAESGAMIWVALAWFALFLLLPFFNRDALRAGDIIAGTWVVEAPRTRLAKVLSAPGGAGNAAAGTDAGNGAQYQFADAQLAIYGERELQVLEKMLRDANTESLVTVHGTICAKIGRDAAQSAGDERAFLEAFYAALRARLEKNMRFGKRKADKFS